MAMAPPSLQVLAGTGARRGCRPASQCSSPPPPRGPAAACHLPGGDTSVTRAGRERALLVPHHMPLNLGGAFCLQTTCRRNEPRSLGAARPRGGATRKRPWWLLGHGQGWHRPPQAAPRQRGSKPLWCPWPPAPCAGRRPDPSDQDQTQQPLTQTDSQTDLPRPRSQGASPRLELMVLGQQATCTHMHCGYAHTRAHMCTRRTHMGTRGAHTCRPRARDQSKGLTRAG